MSRTVNKPQFVGVVTDLFAADSASLPRPQSFLVEQTPNWTLPTHFHLQNQFQVFIAGSGSIGKNPIEPLTVHYASRHSGYGPLISGNEGISYFTLRAMSDEGAWYLPESREHLKTRIPKQQLHAAPSSHLTTIDLQALPAPSEEILIQIDNGGLAAWLIRIPPNMKIPAPAGQEIGGGRFYVVTKGSLHIGQTEMPAWATVFVSRDDSLDLQSGFQGLEILVLQFPEAALASVV
ncbi:MAG: hypothetical protein Q7K57_33180 [Burkholderiaceae bacterium]|nr:hypothetical protein [Burkholderiaceae bacterium]